jgi:hypothetical protein
MEPLVLVSLLVPVLLESSPVSSPVSPPESLPASSLVQMVQSVSWSLYHSQLREQALVKLSGVSITFSLFIASFICLI